MPTTFSVIDDDEVKKLVADRLESHHLEMHEHGVRIGLIWAYNPDGPAIKSGGYPAAATVKAVPQRDRITKGHDAELTLDQNHWDDLTPRQREALVAHELRHLRLAKKVERGVLRVQFDDNGRPKLPLVPGDWFCGDGFREIVAEFGDDAPEYRSAMSVWAKADGAEKRGPEPTLFDPGQKAG